jgi:uncharacterized protein (UPF0332 family)
MSQIQALIEKARRYLRSTELLIQDGDYDSAVSRSYYAMFYSAEAALLKKKMTFISHKAVISAFGQHFVKTWIFDKHMARDNWVTTSLTFLYQKKTHVIRLKALEDLLTKLQNG